MNSRELFDTRIYEKAPACTEWELENQDAIPDRASVPESDDEEPDPSLEKLKRVIHIESFHVLDKIIEGDQNGKNPSASIQFLEETFGVWKGDLKDHLEGLELMGLIKLGTTKVMATKKGAIWHAGEKAVRKSKEEKHPQPETNPNIPSQSESEKVSPERDRATETTSEKSWSLTPSNPENSWSLTAPEAVETGTPTVSDQGKESAIAPYENSPAVNIYSPGKRKGGEKRRYYYRLSWKENNRTRHRHIPGGSTRNQLARDRAAAVRQLLARGIPPKEIAAKIDQGKILHG